MENVLSLEIVKDQEKLSKLSKVWKTLLDASENRDVLYSYQWYKCWTKNYLNNDKMLIITINNSNNLMAIMPLMLTNYRIKGLKIKIIKSMTNERSSKFDYLTTHPSPDLLSMIIQKAFENTKCKMMLLEKVPVNSFIFSDIIKACKNNGLKYVIREDNGHYCVIIKDTFEKYFNKLKSKFRKNIRAAERKSSQKGTLVIEQPNNIAEIMEILKRGFNVELKSWKGKSGRAVLQNKNDKSFFWQLTQDCFELGWINLSLLRNNEDDISFYFCIGNFGVIHALIIGVNEGFKNIAPGILLTKKILEKNFKDKKYKIWDFGGGSDRWKKDFSNDYNINNYKIFIFNNNIFGKVLYYFAKKYDDKNR